MSYTILLVNIQDKILFQVFLKKFKMEISMKDKLFLRKKLNKEMIMLIMLIKKKKKIQHMFAIKLLKNK